MNNMNIKRLLTTSVLTALLSAPVMAATTDNQSATKDNAPKQSTMIVLDGSNSMWGQLQGINKIVTARESLETLLESANDNINFGLLTYGNKRKSGCNDFTLVSKPEDYNKVSLLKDIYRMNPRGRSPIADALKKAASILPPENAHILLVSDGEESCKGDPCAVAKELREANPSLQIDVIGFRAEKEAQLECIAENGNGAFVVADNTERLKTLLAGVQAKAISIKHTDNNVQSSDIDKDGLPGSVEISIKANSDQPTPRANYSIYTLDGNNVAGFSSRTQVKEYLKPGTYRVKASWKGYSDTKTATISSGKNSQLQFDAAASGTLRIAAIDTTKQPVAVNYSIYMKNGDFISRHVLRTGLITRIPAGAYRVKADFNGKIIEKTFDVMANKINNYTFEFED